METCAPFLIEHCRWRAARPGDMLDRSMMASKMSRVGTLNVMQYIRPFTNSIQHPAFQLFSTALGIFQIYQSVMILSGTGTYGLRTFRQLRGTGALKNSTSLQSVQFISKADSKRRSRQAEGENVIFWTASETAAEVVESSCPRLPLKAKC